MTSLIHSITLEKSELYELLPLQNESSITTHRSHTDNASRHSSHISGIIHGIREDIGLVQDDAYSQVPPPEEALVAELERVSREVSGVSQVTDAGDDCSNDVDDVDNKDHPVDGYFAYWQATLAMLMTFATWGANAAFGVFLNFYMKNDVFPGATMYQFALMGGLVVCLANFLAPLTVLAVRTVGQTPVYLTGVAIQTLGYFLAAQCVAFWQLFLCQGLLVGVSFALLFVPGTLVIPTWFDKQLATAMGICVSGAGIGGVVFTLVLDRIIDITGDQKWALRVTGFINLAVSLFAVFFVRVRNKKKHNYALTLKWEFIKSAFNAVFDIKLFAHPQLMLNSVWFGIVLMAYCIVLYSLASYSTSVGLSASQGAAVLAILNALQSVGRPLVGKIGDYAGRCNTSTVVCLYLGIILSAFWLNANSYAEMIVLAIVLGFFVGIGSLMTQSMAFDILRFLGIPEKLPAAWGTTNFIVSFFALPSEVIALALKNPSGSSAYRNAQIFTSCCFFFGALILLVNREWLVRHSLISKKSEFLKSLASKTNYLKRENNEGAVNSDEVVLRRVERFDRLLTRNVVFYFVRMFYPIKV